MHRHMHATAIVPGISQVHTEYTYMYNVLIVLVHTRNVITILCIYTLMHTHTHAHTHTHIRICWKWILP